MNERRFTLTDEHLTLLSYAYIGWNDCEFGAPAINCKRPYGNSDVYGDMCDILGIVGYGEDGPDDATRQRLRALHEETRTALQILVRQAAVGAVVLTGEYVASPYGADWRPVGVAM